MIAISTIAKSPNERQHNYSLALHCNYNRIVAAAVKYLQDLVGLTGGMMSIVTSTPYTDINNN